MVSPADKAFTLSVIGVNHDTAPVAVREQLALPDRNLGPVLHTALGTGRSPGRGATECVLLSTCNRLDLFRVGAVPRDAAWTWQELRDTLDLDVGLELEPYVYRHEGLNAARHLFRVAAGVDSQVLGEVQILGQVQRAWRA